ncbi:hypothetical protein GCM10010275_43850 [Streptomyces litmocidini]|nr:hypothetical protein GCM10010275_43850 [Streptomyces litmocidini]
MLVGEPPSWGYPFYAGFVGLTCRNVVKGCVNGERFSPNGRTVGEGRRAARKDGLAPLARADDFDLERPELRIVELLPTVTAT